MEEQLIKLGSKVSYSDQYDTTQLEFFSREKRRIGYTAPMYGFDVWTCYEVSFLRKSGLPEFHVLRIVNPADSKNIFESKSLKLYLNSFNNTKFSGIGEVIETIKKDLSKGAEGDVHVVKITDFVSKIESICIDSLFGELEITDYTYNPGLLQTTENSIKDIASFHSNLLKSNCEITEQPDFATIHISYVSDNNLSIESFLKYIISFRNHKEFHEPTCERVYNDLYNLLKPSFLEVICQYTRRGGIDINPARTNTNFKLEELLKYLPKTLQQ